MADDKVRATARVRLVLDLPVASAWGVGCQLDQVYRQAAEEAERTVEMVVTKLGGRVLESKVTAVLAVEP